MKKRIDNVNESIGSIMKMVEDMSEKFMNATEELNTVKIALKNFVASSLDAHEDIHVLRNSDNHVGKPQIGAFSMTLKNSLFSLYECPAVNVEKKTPQKQKMK